MPALRARLICIYLLATTVLLVAGPAAHAAPKSPVFGPMIDKSALYQGQSKCDPDAEPGVLAFRDMIMRAYPATGFGSISRACSIGGQSEHKEGRAWDWGLNGAVASDRAAADEVINWLASTDKRGNRNALARRFGVMYLIWNRRIWFPEAGWRTYCVQRKKACRDPEDGDVLHPHTDHVHFSFSWRGARMKTTYWHRDRSVVTDLAPHSRSTGYWVVGANGEVRRSGAAGYFGSPQDSYPSSPVVTMAGTPTSDGYWLVNQQGRVFAYGDAVARGGTRGRSVRVVGIESTSTGDGYWLVTSSGRVFAFGDATSFGDARNEGRVIVGMAPTLADGGYWLFAADGTVFAYGDAPHLGDASAKGITSIVGGDGYGATGYWLVTKRGRVYAYGDSTHVGGGLGAGFEGRIVGLAATRTGGGYYLASSMGDILRFGDATGAAPRSQPSSMRAHASLARRLFGHGIGDGS